MGNNKSSTTVLLAVLFVLFIMAGLPGIAISADEAAGKKETKQEVKEQKSPYANAQISTKIIPSANNTFGYDILNLWPSPGSPAQYTGSAGQ